MREHYEDTNPFTHWGGDGGRYGDRWGKWFGPQARRGDMRPIVLWMLTDKPMHGYEIIRALEHKSHGFWRPSPGSIYPTLQLLEEEDLVTSHEENGKKIYTLTDKGREEAGRTKARAPWDSDHMREHLQARATFMAIIGHLKEFALTGTDAEREQARQVMEETKAKLEAIINQRGTDR